MKTGYNYEFDWESIPLKEIAVAQNSDNIFIYKVRNAVRIPNASATKYGLLSMSVHKVRKYTIGYILVCSPDTIILSNDFCLYCGVTSNYEATSYRTVFRDKYINIYLFSDNEVLVCTKNIKTRGKRKAHWGV